MKLLQYNTPTVKILNTVELQVQWLEHDCSYTTAVSNLFLSALENINCLQI